MGAVLQFRPKRLTGFIPDELPEPFASAYAEVRKELASIVVDLRSQGDTACSEINPDGAA